MGIFDLKHIHCMDDKGKGCGLLFTSPKECNENEEFIHHITLKHEKNPQVIDKKTKELRAMNEEETADHKSRVDMILKIHLKENQEKYPKNKINIVKLDDTETHYIHELQLDPEFGKYEKTQKDEEISRQDLGGISIATIKTTTTHVLRCQCGKEAQRAVFETFTVKKIQNESNNNS